MSNTVNFQQMLCATAVLVLLSACGKQNETTVPPAKQVEVVVVEAKPLEISTELPGRVTPVRVAEVRARVAGIVLKRAFDEGSDVKAGQVLFQIDPAPFKAALSRSQGELSKAEAEVFDAEAVVRRYKPLVEIEAVSQQEYDAAVARQKTALAAKRSAQADVQTAQLNLEYATVRAPISGRIGRALTTEGALVGQGEATPMATIQQLSPIYVDFTQSVGESLQTREALAEGRLGKNADGGATVKATIDGSSRIREGTLLFSDIGVDQTTNQVTLRGRFANEDNVMLPGMYVRVRTELGVDKQAILIPQRAVSRSTDGKPQVMVVNDEGVVQYRLIQTGEMYGSEWRVLSGLKVGEKVIVGGANAVKPEDKVTTLPVGKNASPEQAKPTKA